MEVNFAPSLSTDSHLDARVKTNVLRDLFHLVLPVEKDQLEAISDALQSSCGAGIDTGDGAGVHTGDGQLPAGTADLLNIFKDDAQSAPRALSTTAVAAKANEAFSSSHAGLSDDSDPSSRRALRRFQLELAISKKGGLRLVYPSHDAHKYLRFFEEDCPYNKLLAEYQLACSKEQYGVHITGRAHRKRVDRPMSSAYGSRSRSRSRGVSNRNSETALVMSIPQVRPLSASAALGPKLN
jgi:hypothetical protein